jgi:hypothetical protein
MAIGAAPLWQRPREAWSARIRPVSQFEPLIAAFAALREKRHLEAAAL